MLRTQPFVLCYVERLSSFGGYFVWSVHRRELLDCMSFVGRLPSAEVSL